MPSTAGTLRIVLGDQLNHNSALWDDFDASQDIVFMAEVLNESLVVASSKQRTAVFFSSMRHFAAELQSAGAEIDYCCITKRTQALGAALASSVKQHKPQQIVCVVPGDVRVLNELTASCKDLQTPITWLEDRHFYAEPGEFSTWANHRKSLRMEYWYRHVRRKHNLLVESDGKPVGGKWNYDADNRKSFTAAGPDLIPSPPEFERDDIDRQVIADIQSVLPDLAGNIDSFVWPSTRAQALSALSAFINEKLPMFGDYQDAMWTEHTTLYHSLLSSSLNLKLLDPREVVDAAIAAFEEGKAPLNAVEGFVRQIVGWREFIRGVYWLRRNDWLDFNALQAQHTLPEMYWTADTEMNCMRHSLDQVLSSGYGHHIQRLMVTGLFSILWGVKPQEIHEWYLAMYVDAVAWVEIPNTIGMSQYADGGIVGSKPYIASGAYINRMSNYCKTCKYKPGDAKGDNACPFTTLYWGFVNTHRELLQKNPRLGMQVKNWARKSDEDQRAILEREKWLRINVSEL
ncbi:MAG: cryptochrome/photolyase family protein [Pseudomonadales bacterium]